MYFLSTESDPDYRYRFLFCRVRWLSILCRSVTELRTLVSGCKFDIDTRLGWSFYWVVIHRSHHSMTIVHVILGCSYTLCFRTNRKTATRRYCHLSPSQEEVWYRCHCSCFNCTPIARISVPSTFNVCHRYRVDWLIDWPQIDRNPDYYARVDRSADCRPSGEGASHYGWRLASWRQCSSRLCARIFLSL